MRFLSSYRQTSTKQSYLSDPSPIICSLVTHLQTHSLLFSIYDWCDPACVDANSKHVEVVPFANVDAEKRVDDSLVQIWKLSHEVKLLFRSSAQVLIVTLNLKFRRDFEAEDWSLFCCWCLAEIMTFNLGRDSEARYCQDFEAWV